MLNPENSRYKPQTISALDFHRALVLQVILMNVVENVDDENRYYDVMNIFGINTFLSFLLFPPGCGSSGMSLFKTSHAYCQIADHKSCTKLHFHNNVRDSILSHSHQRWLLCIYLDLC